MDKKTGKSITVISYKEMEALGANLAAGCPPGGRIYLQGELGAGKTTLVRGFLRAWDYHGKVKSPTYTLVEPYQLHSQSIYHFDLYRINDPLELEAIGVRDYMEKPHICLVEWPEKGGNLLPGPDVLVRIKILENGRDVHLDARSRPGVEILKPLPGDENSHSR